MRALHAMAGAILVATLSMPFAVAQPFGTDLFLAAGSPLNPGGGAAVFRLTPAGGLTTVIPPQPGSRALGVMMHVDNRFLAVTEYGGAQIVDPVVGVVVRSLFASPTLSPRSICSSATGDYFLTLFDDTWPNQRQAIFHVDARTGASSTVLWAHRAGLPGPIGQDPATGDLLVIDDRALHRVTSGGLRTTVLVSGTDRLVEMVVDPIGGAALIVMNGSAGSRVLRLDLPTNRVSTVLAGRGGLLAFDRGPGAGEIVVLGTRLDRYSRAGTLVSSRAFTWPGGWYGTDVCFASGRNLVQTLTAPNNRWRLDIDIPGDGGRPFVLGLSLSGMTPNIGVDSRSVQLAPGALLALSVAGRLAPILRGTPGVLDATGHAVATLDLSRFGAALRGVPLWAAAATLDPGAPSGIRTITRTTRILLR